MKIHSYNSMLKEYEISELETDDLRDRKEMLLSLKWSVIVEGNFLEYDNIEEWIKQNLKYDTINVLCYGKTNYDFGFFEYFFDNETDKVRFENIIPDLYTLYPNGTYSKSDGYNKDIPFGSDNL